MGKKVAFVHTISSLVEPFSALVDEFFPDDVEVYHIADEMLLKVVLKEGGLNPFIYRRVAEHIISADAAGVDLVQLTCSSISPCVDPAQQLVATRVLKIDTPMVDKALSLGSRVGVAATAPTTLKPTTALVHERACAMGKDVEVEPVLCEGAYEALFSGDPDTHDRIVRETLKDLMTRNDVIILAQASMARVADTIPDEEQQVPILASPRLAMEEAARVLASV